MTSMLKLKNIPLHSTIIGCRPIVDSHLFQLLPLLHLFLHGFFSSICSSRFRLLAFSEMEAKNQWSLPITLFSRGIQEGGQSNSYTFWYSMDCDISASWLLEGLGGDIAMISPQELLKVRFNSIQVPSGKTNMAMEINFSNQLEIYTHIISTIVDFSLLRYGSWSLLTLQGLFTWAFSVLQLRLLRWQSTGRFIDTYYQ